MVSKIPPTTPRRVASIMVIYSPEKSKKKSIDTDIRCRGYEVNDRDSERLIPTVGANIVTGGGANGSSDWSVLHVYCARPTRLAK